MKTRQWYFGQRDSRFKPRILGAFITAFIVLSPAIFSSIPSLASGQSSSVPSETDDGLDPINLVWTGFSPAWWILQNFRGWNPTLCSLAKTIDGRAYDFTLEFPNTLGQVPPCWGPRFHVRVWDMGEDPLLGHWSIGAVHHEYTPCNPTCHHVVDSWEDAEAEARDAFENGNSTFSIGSYPLANEGLYQGVFNDGNATMIRLSRPGTYPVVFAETGLKEGTLWSVDLDGTMLSSDSNTIAFEEPNGTYQFSIDAGMKYNASPSSGTVSVDGRRVDLNVNFTQSLFSITFIQSGLSGGVPWAVTLENSTETSQTENITFVKPLGEYDFSIGSVAGYRSDVESGKVIVNSDKEVTIRFTANTSVSDAGKPESWIMAYAILGSLAVVGIVWSLRNSWHRRNAHQANSNN